MEKKSALRCILDLCKLGKFRDTLNKLQTVDGEVNNKWITSLLISCCNTCVANSATPENVSEGDLYSLLIHIVSNIKCINESESLSYFQSVFHILKFFIQKKCYVFLAKMESILVPSFLPTSMSRKHIVTYESSASLLHNFVVKADQTEFEPLVEICNIISKMYARVSNTTALLNTCCNCTIHLSHLSCPISYLEAYYFHVLGLAKLDNMKVNSEEDFKSFIYVFTIIYHNMLKDFDFKNAAKFYEASFENGIKIFTDEDCIHVLTLLRFPLVLSPFYFKDKLESLAKCRRSLSNLNSAVQKQLVGNKLHSLIHTVVMAYYKSVSGLEWNNFSDAHQLEFLQFIWDVARLELVSNYSCSCKCLVEKNIYQAFSYFQYITTLLDITVQQENISSDVNKKMAQLLARFCEDVKLLKECNCEKWRIAWNAIGMALYNIAVHLYQNSSEGCLQYFYNLIKYFIKFEVHDTKPILKFSLIGSAFTVVCNYNTKDPKKCLALSALAIRLCPNQKNTFMVNWIKAKVSQRDAKTAEGNEIQKLTLVSAFKHLKNEVEFLTQGANLLRKADKIDLLVYELEEYKIKWKSKIPMMSALKEICELADLTKVVEVIITVFGDCDLTLHDDVPKILQKTLKQYEEKISRQKNATVESTIYLAFLYHMHYKYCVKDVITKNTDDMEKTMSVTPKGDEPPDAIPKDPNDKCDIVSFYDNLKLSRYFGVMKYLNKSLDLFASVKDNFNTNGLAKVTPSMLYNLLMKIAFEYRLHRYIVKSLQALQLALKVALFEENACNIVWTIGFIIEHSEVTKGYTKYLMLIADKHLNSIECTSMQNVKIVLTYYICKAKCLLYEDYKEAYRIFQMANELYDVQEDKHELRLIKSQLHLLHFKFVLMPCELGIVNHKKSTLLTIHVANSTVYEAYNTSKLDGPYEMSLLLNASEELARLHHLLQCPREVRAYCKEIIILAQKLVLPIQCAYFLVYLAHADLRSSRYDDCQVKIEGLANILCLTRPVYNLQVEQENKPPPCTEIEKDIVGITNDMQEMVLDLPVPNHNYRKQFSPSSPTLIIQPFHLPAFVQHEDGCDCFYCTSLEYQKLVLEKTRLDALLNLKQNNVSISTDFFHGALKFYEQCSKRYESYTETVAKYISYDLIPDFKKDVLEAYGFILLNYSSHLMRVKNKADALKITDKLIDLVSLRKLEYIYLYNEALFQKLGYLTEIPLESPIVDEALEIDSLCPSTNVISTTPESKQSKVMFAVHYSPSFSPPKRRVKKCLPFNLSPNQDSVNNNKPQEKTSPTPAQPKTPAPKIKIYTNDGTEQKTKNTTKKLKDKKKVVIYDDSSCSGVTSTPVLSNVCSESGLRTRTRMLTNKLRQSTKKPEASTESAEHTEIKNDKKKPSLRKNLFEQGKLEMEVNVPQGGAIRKTRNRKV